jgi:hypothetical protein
LIIVIKQLYQTHKKKTPQSGACGNNLPASGRFLFSAAEVGFQGNHGGVDLSLLVGASPVQTNTQKNIVYIEAQMVLDGGGKSADPFEVPQSGNVKHDIFQLLVRGVPFHGSVVKIFQPIVNNGKIRSVFFHAKTSDRIISWNDENIKNEFI